MSQIDELRKIIVGDNSEQLSELKQRVESLDARTRDVAEVLAPAIEQGIKDNDNLVNALKAPVSEGLKQAIRAEPNEYAEILYPAIAPSIRLAISQALSSLLVTINQTVESATSISGLRTRFESVRTGVPYAELLLRKSLLYRVEHVYLIDRDSGLMIAECDSGEDEALDSDAVSAMFSAIQSFVQDSFSGDDSDQLTDFKVGSHTIWIAHGPRAMLACVIFGDAPETLKTQLYDCLDKVRTKYAQQLASFNGDTSEFVSIDLELEPLLQVQLNENLSQKQGDIVGTKSDVMSAFLAIVIASVVIFLFFKSMDQGSKLSTIHHYLNATPGIVVTNTYWQGGGIVVEGLQDPDAEIPYTLLKEFGIEISTVHLQTTPFRSLEPTMEKQRFIKGFVPPKGVMIELNNGIVRVTGEAPISWLVENDLRLKQLTIDKRLDTSELRVSESSIKQYLQLQYPELDKTMINKLSESKSNKVWNQIDIDKLHESLDKPLSGTETLNRKGV